MIKSGEASILAFLKDSITDEVPQGWYTSRELAKMAERSENRTQAKLRDGVLNGTVLMQRFRIKTGTVVRPVPHYRMKK